MLNTLIKDALHAFTKVGYPANKVAIINRAFNTPSFHLNKYAARAPKRISADAYIILFISLAFITLLVFLLKNKLSLQHLKTNPLYKLLQLVGRHHLIIILYLHLTRVEQDPRLLHTLFFTQYTLNLSNATWACKRFQLKIYSFHIFLLYLNYSLINPTFTHTSLY